MSAESVGVAINYYSRPEFGPGHRETTRFCIQSLKKNKGVGQIVLVDGSPSPDNKIKHPCFLEGIEYLHLHRELTFAEGFNVGWQFLKEPYVGLIANDVLPPEDTVQKLMHYLAWPDVGCAFPYLSYCDYPGQMYDFVRKPVTCEPSLMTLNLNLFKREVLQKAGGVNESYSGSYNDLILLMKIRQMGYRVVLVGDTRVTHLGQMTISQGTTYKKEKDRQRFIAEYPSYIAKHGAWQVAHWKWPLATTPAAKILWWLCQHLPSTRIRNFLQKQIIKFEPILTRHPARDRQNIAKRIP